MRLLDHDMPQLGDSWSGDRLHRQSPAGLFTRQTLSRDRRQTAVLLVGPAARGMAPMGGGLRIPVRGRSNFSDLGSRPSWLEPLIDKARFACARRTGI